MINFKEISKHQSAEDCWIILHGKVYDVTNFLKEHPGGKNVILAHAGQDGTIAFDQIHSKDIIERLLPNSCFIGIADMATVPLRPQAVNSRDLIKLPSIESVFSLNDFERLAEKVLSVEAWAYYSSAADDEITFKENQTAFHRYSLKPKVLVNVKNVDTSTTLFGVKSAIPVYITATALGKLGHPEGEVILTRAAGKKGSFIN